METEEFRNAAREGELARVQGLAARASGDDREDAMRDASSNGHLQVLRYLVEEWAVDADAMIPCPVLEYKCDIEIYSAFRSAGANGHLDVVRYLVEQCGVRIAEHGNEKTLFEAAQNGHFDIVRYLVEHCGADVNGKNRLGCPVVALAAENGHVDIVRYLGEQGGADINAVSPYQGTALRKAAERGHVDVVRCLVKHCGADMNIKDSSGLTTLTRIAQQRLIDVVQCLVEECDADVNAKDDFGYTAVLRAAEEGHIDVVRCLVEEYGAGVNARSNDGDMAVIRSAGNGHIDIVRYLSKRCGADVNAKNNRGDTALIEATKLGCVDVVRYLHDRCGVDFNAKNNDECTALLVAADFNQMDMVQYLTGRRSVDVDSKRSDGATAMIVAAQKGYLNIVRNLAERGGADVNVRDNDGYTALMKAAQRGHIAIAQCLVEQYHADVNAVSTNGTTALRLAAERGYEEIQRMLMPFVRPDLTNATRDGASLPPSCSIHPSEIELTHYSQDRQIGGDFQAKWLDADAVVKLFIPDASYTSFEDEVRVWQQLRHPNVLKMYGACIAGPHLLFFVCEYASQGSLLEHVKSSAEEKPTIWKYLYEAALGLEYLHERGLVHGDLRCSNILVGSDGMAKLSRFGLSGLIKRSSAASGSVVGSMRWQAPEVVEGVPPSFESDVYSLGMCILEAVTKEIPWVRISTDVMEYKSSWTPEDESAQETFRNDRANGFPNGLYYMISYSPGYPIGDARELVWKMCSRDPRKRITLSAVVNKLERLATGQYSSFEQAEREAVIPFEEYESGRAQEAWLRLETHMQTCDNVEYCKAFDQLKWLHERLRVSSHRPALLEGFHALLTEFNQAVRMSPDQALMMRLSSTRATTNSLYAFQWRIESLMASLGGALGGTTAERGSGWYQQRPDETKMFVLGPSDIFLMLQKLKTTEERAAYLKTLKTEKENPLGNYMPDELDVMKKAYEVITSKLETEDWSELIPEWFIPWYELIIDEGGHLGEGGFGSVNRAKWLDAEVVVKRVILPGSGGKADASTTWSSLSASEDRFATEADTNPDQRSKALEMFRREVDIWFGFSHPHVIRLFGACHVGRPFFVCEYATNGTLVSYLREHPDELWSKLHEAALGVQYLHARDVVHGDLKGNNIVIGGDFKAKVTDFGLSSAASSEGMTQISGAWHWLAPECFPNCKVGEPQQQKRPSFASDVYSLGLCIVEALRVVEAVKAGKDCRSCLPWRVADRNGVRYHATHGTLPARPMCSGSQWKLVEAMCKLDPKQRLKISTVVDELARLANSGVKTQTMTKTGTSPADATNEVTVRDMIAAARHELARQAKPVVESRTRAPPNGLKNKSSLPRWLTSWRALIFAAKRSSCSMLPADVTNEVHNPGDQQGADLLQGAIDQHDEVVSLCSSLWKRLERVHEQIDDAKSDECRASFFALVVEARSFTAKLQDRKQDTMALAETTMRFYALDRALTKFCEAYFVGEV